MKIGFNPQSIVGLDGMPLVGRITFYVHDSDVKATVYSMQGDAFVESQNPQLLNNAGRLDDTVFFDAAIIDVLVEKYIGETGHMTPDSPDSDFEPFDHFEVGFDMPNAESVPTVGTVAELEDADTSVGVVLVTGYYTKGDCAARFYLWDKDSNNSADGGYVIASNNSDSGRWILLWDDDTVPCSFYGIVPGTKEENIAAFLNYPQQVGSHLLPTSPVPRFERGEYAAAVTMSTTKHVKFDSGAKFLNATFTIPSATVDPSQTYVADFYFNGRQPKAESGWFRTLKAFWRCNASELVISHDNFTDKKIDTTVSVQGRVISGAGRIPATYSDGGYLYFYNCAINAYKFLSPRYDRVRFAYARWNDNWWVELASVYFEFGSTPGTDKIVFKGADNCNLDVDDFFNADTFVKAAIANGSTYLDLRGRYLTTLTLDQVVSLSNATANRINLAAATVNLDGVKCDDVRATYADGNTQLSVDNSSVTITTEKPNLSALLCNGSKITIAGTIDPATTTLVVVGGTWDGDVKMTAAELDAFTEHQLVQFIGVRFDNYSEMNVSKLYMEGCDVCAKINLYAYRVGTSNLLNLTLVNNRFSGSTSGAVWPRIWMGYYAADGNTHPEIGDNPLTFAQMKIVGNRFEQQDTNGIYMQRWTHEYGKAVADNVGSWEYHGNTGNCPRLSPGSQSGSDYQTTSGIWKKCDTACNLWAPWANYTDGSFNTMEDPTGLNPTAWEFASVIGLPSGDVVQLVGGACVGQSTPSNTFSIADNNLFIVKPGLTNKNAAPTISAGDFIRWPQFVSGN